MYNPTPDDEVQITQKIFGKDCIFSIRKKKRLSIIDKIKKMLKLADDWIEYEFYSSYYEWDFENLPLHYYVSSDDCHLKIVQDKYHIEDLLWKTVKNLGKDFIKDKFAIYGVIFGKGIHKSYNYNLNEIQFLGTDVFKDKNFESPDAAKLIFDDILDLPHVEILHTGEWNQEIHNEYLYNGVIENTNIPCAGIVVKHVSGDKEKVATFYNPKFLIYIGKES
jgi:hypothetical protein